MSDICQPRTSDIAFGHRTPVEMTRIEYAVDTDTAGVHEDASMYED
jgi:hypothetical protein